MKNTSTTRNPVIAIMGHVDHGKSTLLDYIRNTNVVQKEAGGITQHVSAYEVLHKTKEGQERKITFLDTPGHAAFQGMRSRGAEAADIAILIVSAEDSVKAQTIEALNTIKKAGIPFIVGINKIDKPGSNIEKTKYDLLEHEVYVEGLGGDVPWVALSAKTGQGVEDLLETICLVADMENFTGNKDELASGIVIETKLDPKKGNQATLIVKDGTITKGQFVVAGDTYASTRMLENFLGQSVEKIEMGSPARITGFENLPEVGAPFFAVETKKQAEELILEWKNKQKQHEESFEGKKVVPIIIKTDVAGTKEAIEGQIKSLSKEKVAYKIILSGIGPISEYDIKLASAHPDTIVVGFNVKIDSIARDLSEKDTITIKTFDVIYHLTEWLEETLENFRPRETIEETTGKLKVLKVFNGTKTSQVIGGKVLEGKLALGSIVKIWRRENIIGSGKVVELQKNKSKAREVELDDECGLMVETKIEIAGGDVLEAFTTTIK